MSEQQKKNRNEILAALRQGICRMTYTKLDGEVRHVSGGTLNPDWIPADKLPKKKGNLETASTKSEPAEGDLVHYFDLAANGWRCFFPENLTTLVLE